ncbi:MAG TPA: hypothetical protein EYP56_13305 [Planctomycetaceae bacterium]|nr:hypothetical protein [Planctomycetaceae bacterium]
MSLHHRALPQGRRRLLSRVGGTETHAHSAVNIEPFVAISGLVQDLKGTSWHDTSARLGRKLLYWQRGYGVVSLGKSNWGWARSTLPGRRSTRLGAGHTIVWSGPGLTRRWPGAKMCEGGREARLEAGIDRRLRAGAGSATRFDGG